MFPSLNTEVRRSREKRWLSQFLPSFTFKCQTRRRNETTSPAIHTHTHAKIKVWGAKVSLHVKWRWCKRRKKDEFGGETTRRRRLHTFLSFTSLSLSLVSSVRLVFFSEVSQFSRSRSPAATQRAAVDSLQLFLLSTRVFLRGGPAELLAPHTALHFNAPTPNKNSCCPESAEEAERVTRSALIGCSSKDEWVHFH